MNELFINNLLEFSNSELNDMFTYFRVNNVNELANIIVDNYMKTDYAYMPPSLCNQLVEYSKRGLIENLKILLRRQDVDPSCNGNLAIVKAEENNHMDIVNLLLEDDRVKYGVFYEKYPERAYNIAMLSEPRGEHDLIDHAESGDGPAVYDLIQAGIDPSYLDNLAIVKAEENNHMEIVEYLLDDDRVSSLVLENQYPERAYHMLIDNDDDFETDSDSDMRASPIEDDISTDIEMDVENYYEEPNYSYDLDTDTDIES